MQFTGKSPDIIQSQSGEHMKHAKATIKERSEFAGQGPIDLRPVIMGSTMET